MEATGAGAEAKYLRQAHHVKLNAVGWARHSVLKIYILSAKTTKSNFANIRGKLKKKKTF